MMPCPSELPSERLSVYVLKLPAEEGKAPPRGVLRRRCADGGAVPLDAQKKKPLRLSEGFVFGVTDGAPELDRVAARGAHHDKGGRGREPG